METDRDGMDEKERRRTQRNGRIKIVSERES